MSDSNMSPIEEVLSVTSSSVFFGSNRKRAKNKYSRYMRLVHPDLNKDKRAVEASSRLNEMWTEYEESSINSSIGNKTRSPGRRNRSKLSKIIHTDSYTIFKDSSDGQWMIVENKPTFGGITEDDHLNEARDRIASSISGSPVSLLHHEDNDLIMIAQRDGPHRAFRTRPLSTGNDHVLTLGGIIRAVGGTGRIVDRDLAWIVKRLVFTALVLDSNNIDVEDDLLDHILIDVEGHHAWFLWTGVKKRDGAGDGVLGRLSVEVGGLFPDRPDYPHSVQRMLRFVDGCRYARHSDIRGVMGEYDDLLLELFGRPCFHKMTIPVS